MPQVARNDVKSRAARLRAKGRLALSDYLARQVGGDVQVLIERDGIGRTPQFAQAVVKGAYVAGNVVTARATGHDGLRLSVEAVA